MKIPFLSLTRPLQERITDWYLITMLLIFPLFPGFSGYRAITLSKFAFFLAATALWTIALLITLLRQTPHFPMTAPQWAALGFLLVSLLSWLCSPDRTQAFLGAGRYDGLVTTLACVLVFVCLSAFARPKLLHARCFALSVSLCAVVALLQMANCDPLHLYPAGLGYHDAGIKYSGAFLGTIGNTNLLDALLCLALPLFFSLYVCGFGSWCLAPLLLHVPIVLKAGGDGGKLALALTLLLALPLLLTETARIRRALRCGAYAAFLSALSLCWQPSAAQGLAFAYMPAALWSGLAGAVLLALSLLPAPRRCPSAPVLRRCFGGLSLLLLLLGLAAVLSATAPEAGTRYELGQLLRGNWDDSFGSARIRIWRETLALVPERPLLGGGPGTLPLRLHIQFSRFVPETGKTLNTYVDNAHNVYLTVLVNTGLLGLAALLTMAALIVRTAWRSRSTAQTAALGLCLLCSAIQEFFGLGLCITTPLLWIGLGLLCAGSSRTQPEAISATEVRYEVEDQLE